MESVVPASGTRMAWTMAERWYALHVKPHKERYVGELLQNPEQIASLAEAGAIAVFAPMVRVKPVNPRAAKMRPYFPGYVFVNADLDKLGQNALSWIPGTHGLVSFGGDPVEVPEALIVELQERLARIEADGGLDMQRIRPGTPVRIVSGLFAGYEAIFDAALPGGQRVQVLLAFLSEHPQRVQLSAAEIEAIKRS